VSDYYVPGLGEKDPDKVIRSLMQAHEKTATNETDIAANAAAIAALAAAGYVVGPASATDHALVRFDTATGKLVQNSDVTLGDSDGKLTRTAGISVSGTNTNDSAAAGYVGEVVTASATVALTTATPANLTSVSLTAGDWDIFAIAQFDGAGASVTSDVWASLGTTSATMNSTLGQHGRWRGAATTDLFFPISFSLRASLSGTTTYYLTGQASFTTSTFSGRALLRARRVR